MGKFQVEGQFQGFHLSGDRGLQDANGDRSLCKFAHMGNDLIDNEKLPKYWYHGI